MPKLKLNIPAAEKSLRQDLKNLFATMRKKTSRVPGKLLQQVEILFDLRSEIYEDMNQLQHRSLIIAAAKHLQKVHKDIDAWSWHPEQTSSVSEADLTGYSKGKVVINAEITTSKRPVGTIDKRMASTLRSLATKKGKKYYIVQTDAMYHRAMHKVELNEWRIECLKIA